MQQQTNRVSRIAFLEEMANAITHGVGLILSVLGLGWLISSAQSSEHLWKLSSATIFGSSLILLYAASTFYHSFQEAHLKRRLKIADHCAIYALIAGSYTPFALVTIGGLLGWALFTAVWSLALVGIILKIYFIDRWNVPFTLSYLGMGWLILFTYQPLVQTLSSEGLYLLVAGGLSYSVGSLVYLWEKPIFHHAIWHLFVLGGSTCHYFSVLFYVL